MEDRDKPKLVEQHLPNLEEEKNKLGHKKKRFVSETRAPSYVKPDLAPSSRRSRLFPLFFFCFLFFPKFFLKFFFKIFVVCYLPRKNVTSKLKKKNKKKIA